MKEAVIGDGEEEEVTNLSIARGAPIYVSNMISPLTCIPEFETALLHELQNLNGELDLDSFDQFSNDEISVDELKIFSNEDLVEMAFQKVFNDEKTVATLQPCQEKPDASQQGDCDVISMKSGKRRQKGGTKSNKRKRNLGNERYLGKVDELLKIKQKQDKEKAAARLHSLKFVKGYTSITQGGGAVAQRVERMKSLRSINSQNQKAKPSDVQDHIAVRHPEIVLCIEVYHYKRKWVKTQEFLVLGRQFLTEMRDKINCSTDEIMQKAGQDDPSGYFLIEDVFFNDLRNPSSVDYSEPIFDWLRDSKDDALRKWQRILSGQLWKKEKAVIGEVNTPDLPTFRRYDMHKVRFCDLRFRLGTGYLYCHQGDCKHSIVIRDMRLMHHDDLQNRAAYPMIIFQLKIRQQKCNVCNISKATKVTTDDKWAEFNPCYFCDDCYYLLHYSSECSLLYTDFSVYDYLHD